MCFLEEWLKSCVATIGDVFWCVLRLGAHFLFCPKKGRSDFLPKGGQIFSWAVQLFQKGTFVNMKKQNLMRLCCAVMAVVCLIGSSVFALPVSAASDAGIYMSVSTKPATANASTAPIPDSDTIYAGKAVYLNIAATTHFKLSNCKFYVCHPNSTQFVYAGGYSAQNYFRYSATSFVFPTFGQYKVKCDVTLTDGRIASGTVNVQVLPGSSTSSNKVTNGNVVINWSASSTSSTRNANHTVTLNGHTITPGTIHKTYFSNGTQSTSGNAYYCMYNNKLTYVAGAQCMNYVYYCQLLLFGTDSHTTALFDYEKDDGRSEFYGVRYYRSLSASEYKTLLQRAGAGAHLRTNGHSIFVLSANDTGFYFTDANTSSYTYGANNIKVGFTTYEDYANGQYGYLRYIEYYHG